MENPQSPRERILTTASRLFYSQGVRATGIDQIIAEAKVAKATFYYHYPSKTNLVRAYLSERHASWMKEFSARVEKTGVRGLPALAEALAAWFRAGDFNGCAFINVTAESAEDEWRESSCEHKEALLLLIENLVGVSATKPVRTEIAARALLVVEGMIVRFQMTRDIAVVASGRALLQLLEAEARKLERLDRAPGLAARKGAGAGKRLAGVASGSRT